ncbi:MAG TPA: sugar ABC transporter permease [Anaerolineae bacterium]|nr:sugar ABC transporter permease [Anaerolineae bacterium]
MTQGFGAQATAQITAHRASRWALFKRSIRWYPFLVINLVVFVIFNLVPWISMITTSFTDWDMLTPSEWVGLGNFQELFTDELLRISIANTFYYALMQVPLISIVSLVVAIFVNRRLFGMKFFRGLYFLPNVTSIAVLAMIFWRFLSPRPDGPLNYLLGLVGIPPLKFLVSTSLALPSLVGLAVWGGFGYQMVIWLAGLQGIPSELYDAALVDGASGFKLHRYVTIPLLRPTAAFILVTATLGSLQVFASIYMMTGGGPVNATLTVAYHIYRTAFIFGKLGYASALSILLFAIILAIAYLQGRFLRFGEDVY